MAREATRPIDVRPLSRSRICCNAQCRAGCPAKAGHSILFAVACASHRIHAVQLGIALRDQNSARSCAQSVNLVVANTSSISSARRSFLVATATALAEMAAHSALGLHKPTYQPFPPPGGRRCSKARLYQDSPISPIPDDKARQKGEWNGLTCQLSSSGSIPINSYLPSLSRYPTPITC